MGYHMDMAVDAWGNPHILGGVAICDLEEQSWWNYYGVNEKASRSVSAPEGIFRRIGSIIKGNGNG